jgi:uncharacterized RDD family membrane protein YckC
MATTHDASLVEIQGQKFLRATWQERVGARVLEGVLTFFAVPMALGFVAPLLHPWLAATLWLLCLFAGLAFIMVGDHWLRGAGVGKRMLGLRVMHARHGTPPSAGQCFLRSLKSCTYLSLWGLLANGYDEVKGHNSEEFAVVRARALPPSLPAPVEAPTDAPQSRVNFDDLGDFLSKKFGSKGGDPQE